MRLALFVVVLFSCASRPPPPPPEPEPLVIPPLPRTASVAPPIVGPEVVMEEPSPPPAEEPDMATPSPLALPCVDDSQCGTHRCNRSRGHCAFPCQSDTDCMAGAVCFASGALSVCVPKPP